MEGLNFFFSKKTKTNLANGTSQEFIILNRITRSINKLDKKNEKNFFNRKNIQILSEN